MFRAYALPHPPIAVPSVGQGQEKKITQTIEALEQVCNEIAEFAPETIIFITPHNVNYLDYFHISPGKSATGDLWKFNGKWTSCDVKYDYTLASEISYIAERAGVRAGFSGEKEAKLDHGVVVPMWFINNVYKNYKAIRISQSGFDAAEHYRFGMCISTAVEQTGKKVVLIASSDLSHKLAVHSAHGYAPEGEMFDNAVLNALSSGNFLELFEIDNGIRERAGECGYRSLMILAGYFDRLNVEANLLSYEAPFGVGYAVASFIAGGINPERDFFEQNEIASIERVERVRETEDEYRALARMSLEHKVKTKKPLPMPEDLPEEMLSFAAGVFVSIYKNGALRGCVGTVLPKTKSVAKEIIQNAVSAGFMDDRFDPVKEPELPHLTYKVDVLSQPEPISSQDMLDVLRYGVIVASGHKRGLLLPNLEGVETVNEQIDIACRKAGILPGEKIKLERFEVTRYD